MTAPLLAFDHVSRRFDDGQVVALSDVSFSIAEGECVAIVGRSGSGKSSLLTLAAGMDEPDAGRVLWRGEAVSGRRGWAALRRREIGIVFQEFYLLPTLTAVQNVALALMGQGIGSADQRRRAEEALDALGLAERRHHLPAALSGGERQRVAIARALVRRPALLLADEPTGSLDSANAALVADLLFGLPRAQGAAMVIVTHDEALAARCPRRIRLHDGHVAEDARTDEVPA